MNARFRLVRSRFRTYVHRSAAVEGILARHGLMKRIHQTTLTWQLEISQRPVA